ncbi:BtrH N-terminal domain-containing protein, partial [Actinosynnema sp. NPDC023658]|uniref:BtrH N-terminal domain-containing protein n=1 Tax=Actinosynnema sp. NPDC023658 TaxID=3155465 RepID=UPI0033CFDD07
MVAIAHSHAFAPCAALLNRVDSALLDCVSDDLALLLAQAGVDDVRTPFAARWKFCLVEDTDGPPRLNLPSGDQAAGLATRTGFAPRRREIRGDDAAAVRAWHAELDAGRAVSVVGDAFHMPWLPYHRNEHMAHGFVVEGIDPLGESREPVLHVVDPYDNATPYGRATPLTVKVGLGDVALALTAGSWAVLDAVGEPSPVDVPHQVATNAEGILAAERDGSFARLLDGHAGLDREAVQNLALQVWLLVRDRSLHRLWLVDVRAGLRRLGLEE